MTRSLFGFACVCALGFLPLVGCGENNGGGGSGGSGGTGGSAGTGGTGGTGGNGVACVDNVCPCTEAGIRAAIAEGGGPFTFDCNGPTTVVTEAEIVIDNDVILDGEGNLTVDGDDAHRVLSVYDFVVARLSGFIIAGGRAVGDCNVAPSPQRLAGVGGGIYSNGTLALTSSVVTDNADECNSGGIHNGDMGTLIATNVTVSGNSGSGIGGANLVVTNSTVSGNDIGILGSGTLTNSTVSGNGIGIGSGSLTLKNSTVFGNAGLDIVVANLAVHSSVVGGCLLDRDSSVVSAGYNIESPGDSCGFDQVSDQVAVTEGQLKLGPLQDNGGPTETHALLLGSVAIDVIPPEDCVDADGASLTTDQRGVSRPQGDSCDVGAFELEVAP